MDKPYRLYTALTAAVDTYNDTHYLNRGHLADMLGYRGDNAARQFSAALNPSTHEKSLNSTRIHQLLDALDDGSRMVFFEQWMAQWALRPVSMCQAPRLEIEQIHVLMDETQMESSEAWSTAKHALSDSVLTMSEVEDIRKQAVEARAKWDEVVAMCDKRMKDEEEERCVRG